MENDFLSSVWPEWKAVRQIGRGSFGVVYEAMRRGDSVESRAAIKVISIPQNESEIASLRSEGLDGNKARTYFQGVVNDFTNEIQLMESFKGTQNIVSVEDYKVVERAEKIGWDIYIRMELLTPFTSYIGKRAMNEKEVIKLGCDICNALELCARRNVIHRDIKPENIFINSFGDFKLGDFGIARRLENVTGGLSRKGTYFYMAPEIQQGTRYDASVDLYSLGLVLYRLMNKNRFPFLNTEQQAMNPNERMSANKRRMDGERLPVPCDASPAMAQVILRACSYSPSQRYASASDMKKALMGAANGTHMEKMDFDKTVVVNGPPQDFQKKKSNAPKITVLVLLFSFLAGIVLFAVLMIPVGRNDSNSKESTKKEVSKKNGKQASYDDGQIKAIIDNAKKLASKGDYEGALSIIDTGLISYPDSDKLLDKSEKYTKSLEVKNELLSNAAKSKEAGDYASAIKLLKNEIEKHGNDQDYQDAYTSYCAEYKNAAIAEGDNFAASGEYQKAIEIMNEASAVIGEDVELAKKTQEYTDKKSQHDTELAEQEEIARQEKAVTPAAPAPPEAAAQPVASFYGVWYASSKVWQDAQSYADVLSAQGFNAQIFVTTDWSNLNSERWYVVTAGIYSSEAEAYAVLPSVQTIYQDAYVKYSGDWQG